MEIDNKVEKKVTDPLKLILIILSALLLIVTLYLLIQNINLLQQLKAKGSSTDTGSKQLQDELTKKEQEITQCIQDKPTSGNSTKKVYSFQDFGVYSPSFVGKEGEYTTYEYKRNTIVRKSISPDEKDGNRWGIDVWELTSSSHFLPSLEGYTVFGTQYDFPIFDGYENYGTPRWISTRMVDWKKQESITNKNGIKMYLSYAYAPKSIGSVQLEFYNPNTPSSHQAFVVLWNGVKNYLLASGVTDPSVIEAKNELIKLADTINFRMNQ